MLLVPRPQSAKNVVWNLARLGWHGELRLAFGDCSSV